MKVSREGVILIKSFEGFRPRAERQSDGRWVIGYGHTASAREGATISESEAELLLQYDLMPVVTLLNERVTQPLNQHQFDALASFAVSIGPDRFANSAVLDRINAGQSAQAADALALWPDDSLPDASKRRRSAERALFVANPAEPTRLADLLAAPLAASEPAPVVEERPMPPPWTGLPDADDRTPDIAPTAEAPAVPAVVETPVADWQAQPVSSFPDNTTVAAPEAPEPAFPVDAATVGATEAVEAVEVIETLEVPASDAPALSPAPAAFDEAIAPSPSPSEDAGFPDLTTSAQRSESLLPQGAVEDTLSMAATPLVLTADEGHDFGPIQRPVWDDATRAEGAAYSDTDENLPLDEPNLSIVRHEIPEGRTRRVEWEQTGSWLFMALSGLVACGASAAALRLADSPTVLNGDELRVIGWCLAVIALICVGVSAWNLYVRWGRGD